MGPYRSWTSVAIMAPYTQRLRRLLEQYPDRRAQLIHFKNALDIAAGAGVYEEVFDQITAMVSDNYEDFRYFSGYYTMLVEEIEELIGSDLEDIMSDTPNGEIASAIDVELHETWWVVSYTYVGYCDGDNEEH